MSDEQYFTFDKFVEDLEKREESVQAARQALTERERGNLTRRYQELYREHYLNSTYVSDEK